MKGLPRIERTQLTHITLPTSKKKVTVRPYTVGQAKLFALTSGSNSPAEIVDNLITVADACSRISTAELPIEDFESIFIHSRILSSGSRIDKSYVCKNRVEKEIEGEKVNTTCDTPFHAIYDLKQVKLVTPENFTKQIALKNSDYVLEFREIRPKDYVDMKAADMKEVFIFAKNLMTGVINTASGEIYSDYTEEQLTEFWESLSITDMESVVENYILSYPKHVLETQSVCPGCGYNHTEKTEGLFGFFT
jgi:hypothetical protein